MAVGTVTSHDIGGLIFSDYIYPGYFNKSKLVWGADGVYNNVTTATPWPTYDGTLDTDLLAFKAANHADLALVDSDLLAFKSANHIDVTATTAAVNTVDSDLLLFKSANHSDLALIDSDLLSFKSANHIDLAQIDTDLLAFKSANHSDITSSEPRKVQDGVGNPITSQANGTRQALDVGAITERSYLARAGKLFSTTTDVVSAASTNETPFFLLINPVASGKSIRLSNVIFSSTVANGEYTTYRCYIDPTVTVNGTALLIKGNRQTGQATTIATAYLLPTVTSNGSLFFALSSATGNSEAAISGFTQWVEAGHSVMCSTKQKAANDVSGVSVVWGEE